MEYNFQLSSGFCVDWIDHRWSSDSASWPAGTPETGCGQLDQWRCPQPLFSQRIYMRHAILRCSRASRLFSSVPTRVRFLLYKDYFFKPKTFTSQLYMHNSDVRSSHFAFWDTGMWKLTSNLKTLSGFTLVGVALNVGTLKLPFCKPT